MHIDSLQYFVTVVEEKSISKAANKLHLSQSALSQMIQKLEEDFGHALLHRSNRGVTITTTGEIVLKYAHHIIKNFERMQEEINLASEQQNRITIAGIWSLASYSLPCLLYRIKKKFPEMSFELEASSAKDILSDIKDDSTDFGFIDYVDEKETDLLFHQIGREKVVLIAKHDYKTKDIVTVKDLPNLELILCTKNSNICANIEEALKAEGKNIKDLNVIFNSDTLSAVKQSVLNGFGMAFVPYEAVKHELYEKSIKIINVEGLTLDFDIYMVSKKTKNLSKALKIARDYLIEDGSKSFC